jgi:hypothetical protein
MESVEAMKFAEENVSLTEVARFVKTSPERLRPTFVECLRMLTRPN